MRQMLDSFHYNGKACTIAGFPVHPLDRFKKPVLTNIFWGTAVFLLYKLPQLVKPAGVQAFCYVFSLFPFVPGDQ